jgi:hypothetical protein
LSRIRFVSVGSVTPADSLFPTSSATLNCSSYCCALPNASFTIINAHTNDSGAYRLRVSNGFGSVLSSNAALRVVTTDSLAAVFEDPAYVDCGDGGEAGNLQASLESLGFAVATFTDISAAIATHRRLLFPEFEKNDLALALHTSTRAALSNFVTRGDSLIIHGSDSGRAEHLLNTVFGLSVQESAQKTYGPLSIRTSQAVGTAFVDDPDTLPNNNATATLLTESLPPGARSIYENDGQSAVVLVEWGDGIIIYLGWDWWNAAPIGTHNGGWLSVLGSAVDQHLPLAPMPPVITAQPQSLTTVRGSTASFRVSACGSRPLSYQWRKDGRDINGTNAIYVITNAQTNDAGSYRVVVTNPYGSVTSAVGVLTVSVNEPTNPPPLRLYVAHVSSGGLVLFLENADGTFVTPEQLAITRVCATTNLSLPFSNWTQLASPLEGLPIV